MLYMYTWFQTLGATLHREERGATMVEYGLMVALIAAVCVVIITTLGGNLNTKFSDVNSAINP